MSETRESSATSYARLQRFLVGERRISKQPGVRLRRDPPVPLRDTVAGRDVVPDEEFLEPALPAGTAVQERASREFGGGTWVLVDGPGVSGWVGDHNLLPVGGPDAAGPGADARRGRAARDPVSVPAARVTTAPVADAPPVVTHPGTYRVVNSSRHKTGAAVIVLRERPEIDGYGDTVTAQVVAGDLVIVHEQDTHHDQFVRVEEPGGTLGFMYRRYLVGPVREPVASASGRCRGDAAPVQAGRKAAAGDPGTKAKRARGGGDFQALPVCTNVFHCGFGDCGSDGNCLKYAGLKPTTDGKLPSGGMTKHYNSTHGGIKYAMGKGNTATHMLYGRLVNENGTRQFGAHAPGCTDDNRLCVPGMVQCPDSDMHAMGVKMRRLVSETYRPSEIEYTDMPSGDCCDIGGADDGDEPRAEKKRRAEWSKHNALLAAQCAMQR
jgi:hypothetical protein